MPKDCFKFKQFQIKQGICAMKVGTDAVLLGAWANVATAKNILDIGTGTGVIALMLAQKSTAGVVGIDISTEAIAQATENVAECTWKNRIEIKHIDALTYAKTAHLSFDVIVSNPPYHTEQVLCPDKLRDIARHTESLPFSHLLQAVSLLLSSQGAFYTILPYWAETKFIDLATKEGLHLFHRVTIYGKEGKPAKRVLLAFSKEEKISLLSDELFLRNADGTDTTAYKELTSPYYLHF